MQNITVLDTTGKILYRVTAQETAQAEYEKLGLSVIQGTVPLEFTHVINGEYIKEEPVQTTEYKKLVIRHERNRKLIASDWTQMPDVPLSVEKKTEWAVYRQALRDFPETCDPDNPVWPIPPV